MNYSGDLGVWAPPTSPEHKSIDASRGHQGTRLAGTSRKKRSDRRAAARTAKAVDNTTENVEDSKAELSNNAVEGHAEVEKLPEETTCAEEAPPVQKKGSQMYQMWWSFKGPSRTLWTEMFCGPVRS